MSGPSRPVNRRVKKEREREMAIRAVGMTNVALTVILGGVLAVACGDDDSSPTPGGEAGETSGGDTGQNTGGSKAGSDAGGQPQGGTAGTAGNDQGGAGAEAGAGGAIDPIAGGAGSGASGGAGGEGGGDPDPEPVPVISKLGSQVFAQASDLRGLFYTEDGKLYASGHLGSVGTVDKQVVVGRFDKDGKPDTTFGGDGFVSFNLVERTVDDQEVVTNDGNEESIGLVELETGEIVVQVNVRDDNGKGMDVGLLKLDATGTPVAAFGDNGLKKLVFGWAPEDDALWPTAGGAPTDTSWGIELDESGANQKIVVFGFGSAAKGQTIGTPGVQRTDTDRYILRVLASDGSVDPAFNDGEVFFYNSRGTFNDGGRRGFVESDGSIVSGGYTNFGDGLGNHVLAIRLTAAGKLDTSFGFGIVDRGVARANPFLDDGGVSECYNITRQHESGRYITSGYGSATAANVPSSYGYATTTAADLISLAFTADGKGLDLDWGNRGTRAIQSEELGQASTEDRGRDLLALWDDRVVYAGKLGINPALIVVTPDGEYDPANGLGQVFTYEPLSGTTSHFFRVVASKDGTRIAAATSNHADGARLAVLKVGDE